MKRGKQTCKILKEIRRQIAEANGIELATSECRFKGECLGTCPKCEAEVRFLEQQLRARSLAGRAVSLAGISVGTLAMMLPACTNANHHSPVTESEVNRTDTITALSITDTCAIEPSTFTCDTASLQSKPNDSKPKNKVEIIDVVDDAYIVGECDPDELQSDQEDGVFDFNKERIGESVIITTAPGVKISFENENGEYLEPEDISIDRILKQPNGKVYTAPVDKCRLEYFDLTILWNDLPVFHDEKIEELDSVTLRVIHPQYNDIKTLKLVRSSETLHTSIRFSYPKKQQ